MNGVLLILIAIVILFFTWSSRSPFASAIRRPADSADSSENIQIVPDDGGGLKPTTDPHFPVIPIEILGGYKDCLSNGGYWDFGANACRYKT